MNGRSAAERSAPGAEPHRSHDHATGQRRGPEHSSAPPAAIPAGAADTPRPDEDLLAGIRRRLVDSDGAMTPARIAAAVRAETGPADGDSLDLYRSLESELVGAGPLEPLLADPFVTDVLVNGPAEVWVDRGSGLQRCGITFPDDDAVRRLAVRLAAATGRRLDAATPFTDARLGDGTRLHAVLAPVAVTGTCLSLRIPRPRPFTLEDLVSTGTAAPAMAEVLDALVRGRLATLVTGGTGSGKTTMMGALLGRVDPADRVVIVEDTAELVVDLAHAVRLESRPPNIEGAGGIDLRDLVRQALRMRPDRIVVGEVRGAEVVDLLVALNTGHEGGLSTVHANAAADLPARMEALAALAGLDRAALHSQLASAVQAIVHIRRDHDGIRRLSEIGVLFRDQSGLVHVLDALRLRRRPPSRGPREAGNGHGRGDEGSYLDASQVVVGGAGAQILDRMLAERGGPRPDLLRAATGGR
ncbi:TadA family conjugal transfer-associated ATPase [Protofrankia sp. BMG5.30]|uniref:TadA family conjugal transfer-associated ATPase n=1 Tax=Protofrankia sp. BMG5.30 TaxID=1834514 RepID=UPI000977EA6D|nr:TadA family conjugal transfer-associated ATPase [Protofrankia sp. BMG5.30]ONH37802.1 secretion protein [Protofrankia sp. BMG5.30]